MWDLKPDDQRLWLPAFDLGRRMIRKADMTGIREPNGCPASFKDYEEFVDVYSPRYTRVDTLYARKDAEMLPLSSYNEAIQAPGVAEPRAIGGNLIVSRGSVTAASAIAKSIVLANGDISARTLMHKSSSSAMGTSTSRRASLALVWLWLGGTLLPQAARTHPC